MGIVYKITNLVNTKVYIGITSRELVYRWDQHRRYSRSKWRRSQSHLYLSMHKYGLENFTIEIIDETEDIEKLSQKEIQYIQFYNSHDRNHGYNKTLGGFYGGVHTPETIAKISRNRKGKCVGKDHPNYGKGFNLGVKFSDEHREKISKALKGKPSKCKGASHYLAKPVRCVETGEEFGAVAEAQRVYGRGNINKAVYTGGISCGLHWEFIDEK